MPMRPPLAVPESLHTPVRVSCRSAPRTAPRGVELAGKDSNLDLTAPKAAVLPLHHPPQHPGILPAILSHRGATARLCFAPRCPTPGLALEPPGPPVPPGASRGLAGCSAHEGWYECRGHDGLRSVSSPSAGGFCYNEAAPTEISTLALHDALPSRDRPA